MRTLLVVMTLLISCSGFAAEKNNFFNLRVFPLNAAWGEYIADFNFAPLSFLSVGVIGYSADIELTDAKGKGNGVGGRVTIHLSGERFAQGWFITGYYIQIPKAEFESTTKSLFTGESITMTGTLTEIVESGALIGKMWMWNSGFNTSLAIGTRNSKAKEDRLMLSNADGSATTQTSFGGSEARVEFALGWAF